MHRVKWSSKTYVFIQLLLTCLQGQATDIKIQAEEILKLKAQINNLYVRHTGLALENIERSIERDNFMSPTEAKEFGIIDKILNSPPKHNKATESGNTNTQP